MLDHIHSTTDLQAQHGEVTIPVVNFIEAATGHDVGVG